MAPAGKKKKEKGCCNLLNPMSLFKDDEFESVSDSEAEQITYDDETYTASERSQAKGKQKSEVNAQDEQSKCVRMIQTVVEVTGKSEEEAYDALVWCDFDVADAIDKLFAAEEPSDPAPRPSDPGPSNRGVSPVVGASSSAGASGRIGGPVATPAEPVEVPAVVPKEPEPPVVEPIKPVEAAIVVPRPVSPIVTPKKPLEVDVSEGVANLQLESPEAASPEKQSQEGTDKEAAPTDDHIAIGLNVQGDSSVGLTLAVDPSADDDAKDTQSSGMKRPRGPISPGAQLSLASPISQSQDERSAPTPRLSFLDASPVGKSLPATPPLATCSSPLATTSHPVLSPTESVTGVVSASYVAVHDSLPIDHEKPAPVGPESNRARPGNAVQVSVVFNEPVSDVKVSVGGHDVAASELGDRWVAETLLEEDTALQAGDLLEIALTEFTDKRGSKVYCHVAGPTGTDPNTRQTPGRTMFYYPPHPYQGNYPGDELQQAALWLAELLVCSSKTQQVHDLRAVAELADKEARGKALCTVLKDGLVLCTAANTIKPNIIDTKVHKIKASVLNAPKTKTKTGGKGSKHQWEFAVSTLRAQAQARENQGQFLAAVKELGVRAEDLYSPESLLEKNECKQVVATLHALGRQCYSVPGYLGACLGPEPGRLSAELAAESRATPAASKKKWDPVQTPESVSRRGNTLASSLEKNLSGAQAARGSPMRY